MYCIPRGLPQPVSSSPSRFDTATCKELSELKRYRGITYRTDLEGREIYPESTDLDIYRLATHLASLPLPTIGVVLVATMDGDFTLVDRAIEERFGFSVAKNHRSLKPWLKRQAN